MLTRRSCVWVFSASDLVGAAPFVFKGAAFDFTARPAHPQAAVEFRLAVVGVGLALPVGRPTRRSRVWVSRL